MKLGTYTFEWTPDEMTEPKEDRVTDSVKTYSSVAVFSWGVTFIGKILTLEWEWMTRKMFAELAKLEAGDAALVFYPEQRAVLYHGAVTGGDFVVGDYIVGGSSGATSEVVEVGDGFIIVDEVSARYELSESITTTTKSASLTAVEQSCPLTVEIMALKGELAEVTGYEAGRRHKVSLSLIVMGEV